MKYSCGYLFSLSLQSQQNNRCMSTEYPRESIYVSVRLPNSCSLHFSGGPPLRRGVAVWCSLPSLLSPPGARRASELAPLAPDAPAGQAGRQILKALAGSAGQLMFAQFLKVDPCTV